MPIHKPSNTLLTSKTSPIAQRTRSKISQANDRVCIPETVENSNTDPGIPHRHLAVSQEHTAMAAHAYTKFDGSKPHNAHEWIDDFLQIMDVNGLAKEKQLGMFKLSLTGFAKTWLNTLVDDQKDTLPHAIAAFKDHFKVSTFELYEIRTRVHLSPYLHARFTHVTSMQLLIPVRALVKRDYMQYHCALPACQLGSMNYRKARII